MVRRITILAAETRSITRGVIAVAEADVQVSRNTIEHVVLDVGGWRENRRNR